MKTAPHVLQNVIDWNIERRDRILTEAKHTQDTHHLKGKMAQARHYQRNIDYLNARLAP